MGDTNLIFLHNIFYFFLIILIFKFVRYKIEERVYSILAPGIVPRKKRKKIFKKQKKQISDFIILLLRYLLRTLVS